MRKYIVAGNWKMNTTVPEGVELAKAVVEKAKELPANVELVVAPPFTHLASVAEVLKGSKVALSAQNCADHEKGAYTGEVSVNMLTSVGCTYTILGHSERRQYYGETDEKLVEKTKLALAAGLKVILCVGENLEEREAGRHFDVVTVQTKNVLYNFSAEEMKNVVIAYEPVWAIGTGKTATIRQGRGRGYDHPLRWQLQAVQREGTLRPAGHRRWPHRRRRAQGRRFHWNRDLVLKNHLQKG